MIIPSEPVVTFTLKLVSISVAPRITISSLFTTEPLLLTLAYIEADIFIWLGFSLADLIAFRSKHCTSNNALNNPSLYISTTYPVIPAAKLPTIFLDFIKFLTSAATARDIPPAPVWKLIPSFKYPDCSINLAVKSATFKPIGFLVIWVVPETIPLGSPIASITKT